MLLSTFWETYNSDDSFLPFFLPLAVWITMYFWGKSRGLAFHDWLFMQNLHNITCVILGLISLYFDDNEVFNERITILFSLSYFCLDFVDCVIRFDYAYTAHAFFCLALGVGNYITPLCRTLRTNSKASMVEISSPFLHIARQTRKPAHFLLFVFVFTCCRMIWLPIMMKQVHDGGLLFMKDVRQILLMGFYCLNMYWYFKMLRIVFGKDSKRKKKDT
jgi:hypothetical protein